MSLTTGNQLRAARALIGQDQTVTAELAGVDVNTIRSMEASNAGPLKGRFETVAKVQAALEKAGIEFLNSDAPGVRLRGKT